MVTAYDAASDMQMHGDSGGGGGGSADGVKAQDARYSAPTEGDVGEAENAATKAKDIHQQWKGSFDEGAVCVTRVFDRVTGTYRKLVTVQSDAKLPNSLVKQLKDEGYEFDQGQFANHAEQNAMDLVKQWNKENLDAGGVTDRYVITEGGVSRNICDAHCAPDLEDGHFEVTGTTYRAIGWKTTPYRAFIRAE